VRIEGYGWDQVKGWVWEFEDWIKLRDAGVHYGGDWLFTWDKISSRTN